MLTITLVVEVISTSIIFRYSKNSYIDSSILSTSGMLTQIKKNTNLKLKSLYDITEKISMNPDIIEIFNRDENITVEQHIIDSNKTLEVFKDISLYHSDINISMLDFYRDVIGGKTKLNLFQSHEDTLSIDESTLLKHPLYHDLITERDTRYKLGIYNKDFVVLLRFINWGDTIGGKIIIDKSRYTGIIIGGLKRQSLNSIYNGGLFSHTGHIYVMLNNGELLSSSDMELDISPGRGPINTEYFMNMKNNELGNSWIDIEGENYLLNYCKDNKHDFYVYSLQSENMILQDYEILRSIKYRILIIRGIIISVLTILIAIFFTKPIDILTKNMIKFMNERDRPHIEDEISVTLKDEIRSKEEIGILSNTFVTLIQTQRRLNSDIFEKERMKAIQENRSKEYLSTILNSLPSMLISIDQNQKITQWNTASERVCKLSVQSVAGQVIWDILPILNKYKKSIISIVKCVGNDKFETKNVEWGELYINITVSPLTSIVTKGAIIRIDDVTEKLKIGELLVQSEKMLSVGGLAAGMAHEINNPLGGMMQNADVIHNRLIRNITLPASLEAAENAGTTVESIKKFMELRNIPKMLVNISESGVLMKDIITSMLSFSRKGDDITSTFNLIKIINKAINLASADSEIGSEFYFKTISIIKNFEDDFPLVLCDGTKIQQVLLNILLNASHAMFEAGTEHPKIIIKLNYEVYRNMAVITIKDNGPGMPEEVRRRIFEPFFTTKKEGIGTGLGLSVSYFIISENHNGELSVESSPGHGAKFTISIPVNH